jgi:hypothetical protein
LIDFLFKVEIKVGFLLDFILGVNSLFPFLFLPAGDKLLSSSDSLGIEVVG